MALNRHGRFWPVAVWRPSAGSPSTPLRLTINSVRRFISDGRIRQTNNPAERALRGIALVRKAWLFAGSDRGGERAAAMYAFIVTAKLNEIVRHAWLADVLARIADQTASRLDELLPWNWKNAQVQ